MNWVLFGSVIGLFFISCNSNPTAEGDVQVLIEDSVSSRSTKKMLTAKSPQMQSYLALQKAFVSSNSDSVREVAESMLNEFSESDEGRVLVKEIVQSTDIAAQRVLFEKVTNLMISRLDTNQAQGLYYQHCPMAFDNEGASWISDKERIANPYFGDEMLRCGFNKKIY